MANLQKSLQTDYHDFSSNQPLTEGQKSGGLDKKPIANSPARPQITNSDIIKQFSPVTIRSVDAEKQRYYQGTDKAPGSPIFYGDLQLYSRELRKITDGDSQVRIVEWALYDKATGKLYTPNYLDSHKIHDFLYSGADSLGRQESYKIDEFDYASFYSNYDKLSKGGLPKEALENDYRKVRDLMLYCFQLDDVKSALSLAKDHFSEILELYPADQVFQSKWDAFALKHQSDFLDPVMDYRSQIFSDKNLVRDLDLALKGIIAVFPSIWEGMTGNVQTGRDMFKQAFKSDSEWVLTPGSFFYGVGQTSLDVLKIAYNTIVSTAGAIETPVFGTHVSNELLIGKNEKTSWKQAEDMKNEVHSNPSPMNIESFGIMSNMKWADTGLSALVVGGIVVKALKNGGTKIVLNQVAEKLSTEEGKRVVASNLLKKDLAQVTAEDIAKVTEQDIRNTAKNIVDNSMEKSINEMSKAGRLAKGKNPSIKGVTENINTALKDLSPEIGTIKAPRLYSEVWTGILEPGYDLSKRAAIATWEGVQSGVMATGRFFKRSYYGSIIAVQKMFSDVPYFFRKFSTRDSVINELSVLDASWEKFLTDKIRMKIPDAQIVGKVPAPSDNFSVTVMSEGKQRSLRVKGLNMEPYKQFVADYKKANAAYELELQNMPKGMTEAQLLEKHFGGLLGTSDDISKFRQSIEGYGTMHSDAMLGQAFERWKNYSAIGFAEPELQSGKQLLSKLPYVPEKPVKVKPIGQQFKEIGADEQVQKAAQETVDFTSKSPVVTEQEYSWRRQKLQNLADYYGKKIAEADEKFSALMKKWSVAEEDASKLSLRTAKDVEEYASKNFGLKKSKAFMREFKELEAEYGKLYKNNAAVMKTMEHLDQFTYRSFRFAYEYTFYNAGKLPRGVRNWFREGYANQKWVQELENKYANLLTERDNALAREGELIKAIGEKYGPEVKKMGTGQRKAWFEQAYGKGSTAPEAIEFQKLSRQLDEVQMTLTDLTWKLDNVFARIYHGAEVFAGTVGRTVTNPKVAVIGLGIGFFPPLLSAASSVVVPVVKVLSPVIFGAGIGGIAALDYKIFQWAKLAGRQLDKYMYPSFYKLMAIEGFQKSVTANRPEIVSTFQRGFVVDAALSGDNKVLGMVLSQDVSFSKGSSTLPGIGTGQAYLLDATGRRTQLQIGEDGSVMFVGSQQQPLLGNYMLPGMQNQETGDYMQGGPLTVLGPGKYTIHVEPKTKDEAPAKGKQLWKTFSFTVNADGTITRPEAVALDEKKTTAPSDTLKTTPVQSQSYFSSLVDYTGSAAMPDSMAVQPGGSVRFRIREGGTILGASDGGRYKVVSPDGKEYYFEAKEILNDFKFEGRFGAEGTYKLVPVSHYDAEDGKGPIDHEGKPLTVVVSAQPSPVAGNISAIVSGQQEQAPQAEKIHEFKSMDEVHDFIKSSSLAGSEKLAAFKELNRLKGESSSEQSRLIGLFNTLDAGDLFAKLNARDYK
ncbi:MAG: hypothetical protein WC506_02925 [Candidatus Micrarchaeia archaeon]